jgi:predicted alpha/beta-fold hydrolase
LALDPEESFVVALPDGDAIVLHENRAVDAGQVAGGHPVLMMLHGLGGCHASPYMVRLADRFLRLGWTVIRADMRGCGAARPLARGLAHAGRSDDVAAMIEFVAQRYPDAPLAGLAVSLGGNQWLRLLGRVGAGLEKTPRGFDRLRRVAVVAPPIDLVRCSENMGRLSRRIYNYYFIRALFERVGPQVRQTELFQAVVSERWPRTLFDLDDRLTAPLSGFAGAMDYYRQCGAISVASENPIETLVLAAGDDPIVPADCFARVLWPGSTQLVMASTGGHAGFLQRGGSSWMDECVVRWLSPSSD